MCPRVYLSILIFIFPNGLRKFGLKNTLRNRPLLNPEKYIMDEWMDGIIFALIFFKLIRYISSSIAIIFTYNRNSCETEVLWV